MKHAEYSAKSETFRSKSKKDFLMNKDFRKKSKNLIKRLVKEKDLKLYTMKISLGECTKTDYEIICDLLLNIWQKINWNRSVFARLFLGFTRELIIEIDGEIIRPYLYFVLFANKSNGIEIMKLKNLALFSVFRASKILEAQRNLTYEDFNKIIVPIEELSENLYDRILDDLLKPCIRVIKPNQEIEELLKMYQYNRQLCSRGGIVSKRNLERNVSLER